MQHKKYLLLTFFSGLLFIGVHSQVTIKNIDKIKFQTCLQAGILIGQNSSKSALMGSIINGLKYKQSFAGLGIGIDFYGQKRSIPLFIALQKEFSPNINTFFLYGQAGYNFAWLKEQEKRSMVTNYNESGGLFYDLGLGYKFKTSRKNIWGLSLGYSFKKVNEKYAYAYDYVLREPSIYPSQTDLYIFRTIALKLNWWFF